VLTSGKPLEQFCRLFEAGIIALVDERSDTFVMYALTVHATINLDGGILVGFISLAAQGHAAFTTSLKHYELLTRAFNNTSESLRLHARQILLSLALDDVPVVSSVINYWDRQILPQLISILRQNLASQAEKKDLKTY
jgi:hypothetical protein